MVADVSDLEAGPRSARGKKRNQDSENKIPIDYNLRRFPNCRRFSGQDRSIIFSSAGGTAVLLTFNLFAHAAVS